MESLYTTIKELSLITTKITWLHVTTKNEFGGPRDEAARLQIEQELNRLLPLILPNPQERAEWIKRLQESLPPRR